MAKPLAKSVLVPLDLTTAASPVDANMHKKILGSGKSPFDSVKQTTTLIISDNEMKDIIKIFKSLEDHGLLLKGVSKTIQNEAKKKEKKGGFPGMLLGTSDASLLRNKLTGKGTIIAGKGTLRAGQDF